MPCHLIRSSNGRNPDSPPPSFPRRREPIPGGVHFNNLGKQSITLAVHIRWGIWEELDLGQDERGRSPGQIARKRRRRGRIRNPGHPDLRHCRRTAGRAGHPHGHDPATTYMADGYARTSGKPGVALVVPGAGLYNAASGLTNAYSRSTPVLLIAGQVPRGAIGKNLGAVHEVEDQLGTVRDQVAATRAPSPGYPGRCIRSVQADAHGSSSSRSA